MDEQRRTRRRELLDKTRPPSAEREEEEAARDALAGMDDAEVRRLLALDDPDALDWTSL